MSAGAFESGFFLAGNARDTQQTRVRWFAVVDGHGKSTVHSLGPGSIHEAVADAHGNLWFAGTAGTDLLALVPWVGCARSDGQVVGSVERKVDVTGSSWYALTPARDGVVAAGVLNTPRSGESKAWALAVECSGRVRWDQRLGSSEYFFFTAATALGEDVLLGGGKTSDLGQPWWVRIDGSGEVKESRWSPELQTYVHALTSSDDGATYASGKDRGGGGGAGVILRLGADGRVLWRRTFGTSIADTHAPLVSGDLIAFLAFEETPAGAWEVHVGTVKSGGDDLQVQKLPGGDHVVRSGAVGAALLPPIGTSGRPRLLRVSNEEGGVEWALQDL